MRRIINLTQHPASQEQLDQGVFDLPDDERNTLSGLLTFEQAPQASSMARRARALVELAWDALGAEVAHPGAMIGGAPYFMATLERALMEADIRPMYSFTRREVEETQMPDGTTRKVAVFRHLDFVLGF